LVAAAARPRPCFMPQIQQKTTSGPLMGFSDPFSDIGNGIRHADTLARAANSRACLTRHLPLSTFLTSSGVCTSDPFATLFHAAPLMGFPSPVLEGWSIQAEAKIDNLASWLTGFKGNASPPEGRGAQSRHPKGRLTQEPPDVAGRRSVTQAPGRAHLHRQRTSGQGRTQGGSTFQTPTLSWEPHAQANPNKSHKPPAKENPTETMSLPTGARPESLSPDASAQSAKADQTRTRHWNALAL
jgi:hypothetical protein